MGRTNQSTVLSALSCPYFVPTCFGVYFLLRAGLISLVPIDQHSDSLWYHDRAVALASGQGYSQDGVFTAFWPVGWPGFLGLLYWVFGRSAFVGQITNLMLAAVTFLLALRLGSAIFADRIVGRLTVLILTFYPNQIGYVPNLTSEVFYTALLLLAVFVIARDQRLTRLILCGILFGVATLTKAQTLLVPAALFAGWWLLGRQRERFISHVRKAAVAYLAMAVVILPWTVRNYIVFGQFVLISTNGGATLLTGNNPSAQGDYTQDDPLVRRVPFGVVRQVEADRLATSLALSWIRDNPGAFAILIPEKVWRLWAPDGESEWAYQSGFKHYDEHVVLFRFVRGLNQLYYACLMVLFALSALPFLRQRNTLSPYAGTGYILAAYFTGISVVFSGQSRFHFPLVPYISMCAAWMIAQWMRRSARALALPTRVSA
jgi:4-amino-4-deoxy-L-arabinose transferase-like glycosyltransferase